MGQVKESKRGNYNWYTGKYRRRFLRLLLSMAVGVVGVFIYVFVSEEIMEGEILQKGIDFPSELPALFYGTIESIRQSSIYQLLLVFFVCCSGTYGIIVVKTPSLGQQVKEAGQNGIELFVGMVKAIITLPFAILMGVLATVICGPIGGIMGLVGAAPAAGKMLTTAKRYWGKVFKNVQVLPILMPFLVPFFLVYFFLMIIPELIVGTFSDKIVETLDNTVIAIGVLSWIVGIIVWRFLL